MDEVDLVDKVDEVDLVDKRMDNRTGVCPPFDCPCAVGAGLQPVPRAIVHSVVHIVHAVHVAFCRGSHHAGSIVAIALWSQCVQYGSITLKGLWSPQWRL